ncbi:MAG: hypothetical protein ACOVQ7_12395 [Limnoraphis robusta]|jgi:hypothetical protein
MTVYLHEGFNLENYRRVSQAFSLVIPAEEISEDLLKAEIQISRAKHLLLTSQISFMDYCDIVDNVGIDVDDHAYEIEKNLEYLEII